MFSNSTQYGRASRRRALRILSAMACTGLLLACAQNASADVLSPSDVFMSAFHAPRLNNAGVDQTRANALEILSNGVVDRTAVDRIDTWNNDDNGIINDFVGFQYEAVNRFDSITIELGNQFPDGGDWDSVPSIYILKNPTLVGDTVEPDKSPSWVQVTGATETTGHTFSPLVTPGDLGAAGQIRFDLSAIPADQRTGWGWAVGGVDGNANASNIFHFVSLTEAFAEGVPVATRPPIPQPATPVPVNVVANSYNTPGINGDGLAEPWRGNVLAGVTNGLLDRDVGLANDGFDTYSGDAAGTQTDFVGLQYGSQYRFDTVTVELGNQFADGGDWEATPRIFILKNSVDTNTTRPEDDPANWLEVTGATETTGHVFDPITIGPDAAGGTITFDLSAIPADQRTGWGWAVGGVDGNQNGEGVVNFVSVTELDATGELVPRPYDLQLEVLSNGQVRIANETAFDISLDFYEVTSPSGSLDLTAGGWNSLENPAGNPAGFPSGNGTGNGWEEFGNLDETIVAESYLQGSSIITDGASVNLGALVDGGAQDIAFRYRTPGGQFVDAEVLYLAIGDVDGDYSGNGVVDAADYTVWRDSFGQTGADLAADGDGNNVVNQLDYTYWKTRFGNTSGSGSATANGAAVPEPGALLMFIALALGGSCFVVRRNA